MRLVDRPPRSSRDRRARAPRRDSATPMSTPAPSDGATDRAPRAAPASASEVVVHPLVLLSVVDHFRRCDEVRDDDDARRRRGTRGRRDAGRAVARARRGRGARDAGRGTRETNARSADRVADRASFD